MAAPTSADTRNLARFRYAVRKFLHSSDAEARRVGVTPQQHQLLLCIAGFMARRWATVGEIADFLQLRHHSAVGLIDRAETAGLVRRQHSRDDRRQVQVTITTEGLRKLRLLSPQHRKELAGMRRSMDLFGLERSARVKDRGARRPAGARKRSP
jgi:DNA-binding MarR family transcriptional regulator